MSTLATIGSDSSATSTPLVIVLTVVVALALAVVLDVVFCWWRGWTRWWVLRNGLFSRFVHLRWTSTTRSLIGHLSAITNLNLPLPGALKIAGQSEPGLMGHTLRQMALHTAAGKPLAEALQRAHAGCSPLVVSVVAAGEQAGQLPQALADLEQTMTDQLRQASTGLSKNRQYWLYLLVLALITFFVLTSVMIVIMPKFEEIFRDFNVTLPGVTVALLDLSGWFLGGPVLVLLSALLLCLIVAGVIALALRDPQETIARTILDTCGWIPGLSRPIAFGQGMSTAVRVVAMGLASGMTLQRACGLAATLDVNRYLRRRWVNFARLLDGGMPGPQAAERAGLGNVFAWACRTLSRGSADVSAVLQHAADYHRAMADRWWRALAGMLWPLVTCALGCMVGFVVLALFMPLIALINATMGGL